jgi:hypothetical protein
MKFNFEEEREKLVQHLTYLRGLEVREYTYRRKWDELRNNIEPIRKHISFAKKSCWKPDVDFFEELPVPGEAENMPSGLSLIEPEIVFVKSMGPIKDDFDRAKRDENDILWETYRFFLSSGEYNDVPARIIKMLIRDARTKLILGIASIASDIPNLSSRDNHIGWTKGDKYQRHRLNNVAIASTIVPTQPFGYHFFGGKLIASLMASKKISDEWEVRYGNPLVGITTTSLYGGNKSQYDDARGWERCGLSKGIVPITPDKEIDDKWRKWIKAAQKEKYDEITDKEERNTGVTGKIRNLIYKTVDIPKALRIHGHERGVYWSSLYENTKEFLCGRIEREDLVQKVHKHSPKRPFSTGELSARSSDISEILDWWYELVRTGWQYKRAQRKLNQSYEVTLHDEVAYMDWETAKVHFFGQ